MWKMYSLNIILIVAIISIQVTFTGCTNTSTVCYGSPGTPCIEHRLSCPNPLVIQIINTSHGYRPGCNDVNGLADCSNTTCCNEEPGDCFITFSSEENQQVTGHCSEKETCAIRGFRRYDTAVTVCNGRIVSAYSKIQYDCVIKDTSTTSTATTNRPSTSATNTIISTATTNRPTTSATNTIISTATTNKPTTRATNTITSKATTNKPTTSTTNTITYTETTQNVCALFENKGECVNRFLPCPVGKVTSSIYNCGSSDQKCCYTPPIPPTPPPPVCGVRKPLRITSRIFNANNVLDACRWPWVVSIRVRQNSFARPSPFNTDSLCTGVLVKGDTVLTSANCLHMASVLNNRQRAGPNLLVVAGDLNTKTLDTSNPTPRERYHTVLNTYIHPGNYRPDETLATLADIGGDNDIARKSFNIAVLKLNGSVELGDCREIACLPSYLDLSTRDNGVKNCHIASYGTSDSTQNPSENLKEAPIRLYPSYTCDLISYPFTNAPGATCGRFNPGRTTGLCQGDDGGMVICQDAVTSTWKLFGLIDYAKFKQCQSSSNTDLLTFTDLRNQDIWNWVNSRL